MAENPDAGFGEVSKIVGVEVSGVKIELEQWVGIGRRAVSGGDFNLSWRSICVSGELQVPKQQIQ